MDTASTGWYRLNRGSRCPRAVIIGQRCALFISRHSGSWCFKQSAACSLGHCGPLGGRIARAGSAPSSGFRHCRYRDRGDLNGWRCRCATAVTSADRATRDVQSLKVSSCICGLVISRMCCHTSTRSMRCSLQIPTDVIPTHPPCSRRRSRASRRFAPGLRQLLQCRKKFHKPRSPNSQACAAAQGLASPL